MTRNTGFALDLNAEFGRDALLGLLEPVPNLRLGGADAIGEGLLASGDFTSTLERIICHKPRHTEFSVIRNGNYLSFCSGFSTKLSVETPI